MSGKRPAALDARPTILVHQDRYLQDFYEMSAGRDYSDAGHPFPLSNKDVMAHCQLYGIESTERRVLLKKVIQRIDAVWLDLWEERRARNKPVSQPKSDVAGYVVPGG